MKAYLHLHLRACLQSVKQQAAAVVAWAPGCCSQSATPSPQAWGLYQPAVSPPQGLRCIAWSGLGRQQCALPGCLEAPDWCQVLQPAQLLPAQQLKLERIATKCRSVVRTPACLHWCPTGVAAWTLAACTSLTMLLIFVMTLEQSTDCSFQFTNLKGSAVCCKV